MGGGRVLREEIIIRGIMHYEAQERQQRQTGGLIWVASLCLHSDYYNRSRLNPFFNQVGGWSGMVMWRDNRQKSIRKAVACVRSKDAKLVFTRRSSEGASSASNRETSGKLGSGKKYEARTRTTNKMPAMALEFVVLQPESLGCVRRGNSRKCQAAKKSGIIKTNREDDADGDAIVGGGDTLIHLLGEI